MLKEEIKEKFTEDNRLLRIARPPWGHNKILTPKSGTLYDWDETNIRLAMMLEDLLVQKLKDKRKLRRTLRGNLGLDPFFPQKYWPSEIVILDFELKYGDDFMLGNSMKFARYSSKQEICVYCPLRGGYSCGYIDRTAYTNEQFLMCTIYFMWKYDHPFIMESFDNAKLYLELGV